MFQVNISVLDVNDNDPMFTTTESRVSFREDVASGTLIYIARARDRDSGTNSRLQYAITGDVGNRFHIDSASGRITLRGSLDRETSAEHRITVSVTDAGTPSRSASMTLVLTVLDVNDHYPVFNSDGYSFQAWTFCIIGCFLALSKVKFSVTLTSLERSFCLAATTSIITRVQCNLIWHIY